ncbi:MAG: Gfo/Idh/MocA family oxidoreductase [Fimbriimonadaceae bacterium]
MRFRQHPVIPANRRPIAIIGAGSIVRNAHLPAYEMCGFEIAAVMDRSWDVAERLASDFEIPAVATAISELPPDVIFDLAVPASAVAQILEQLPDGAFVLIQKPLGEDLAMANQIAGICREKGLHAAVNFQLRSAPYSLIARDIIQQGLIGDILEIEACVCVQTPWALWDFLEKSPRMEIVYHSIHYLDFIRCLIGDPASVKANTLKHRASPKLHSSRSAMILDYGPACRALVNTYHAHDYGPKHQRSEFRIEGSKGVIAFQMGLNMAYPTGERDWFEWCRAGESWQEVPLEGSWFPHAFRGPMSAMMTWAEGGPAPETHLDDALQTMALVEACYEDAERPGTILSG